jgi:hypothetical protein
MSPSSGFVRGSSEVSRTSLVNVGKSIGCASAAFFCSSSAAFFFASRSGVFGAAARKMCDSRTISGFT